MQVYNWFNKLKVGQELIRNNLRSNRPKISQTDKNIEKIHQILGKRPGATYIGIGLGIGVPKASFACITLSFEQT